MTHRIAAVGALARRRGALALVAAFAMLAGLLGTATVAGAAGNAVLDVSIQPVDSLTGQPQTDASFGEHNDQLAYKVGYSCAAADCADATVELSPAPPNPYGLATEPILRYANWTAPAGVSGASISGTATTGITVKLGDLSAGTSGTFLVVFNILPDETYTTPRPAQFYPSGFQIMMSATMDATSATKKAVADAQPVTWTSKVPEPSIFVSSPKSVKPDTNVTWQVYMGSGSFPRTASNRIAGLSQWVAAGSYTVTEKLDPRAQYVASSGGGVYDEATHSVKWSLGTKEAPDVNAAGGWGSSSTSGWAERGPYYPRKVTVTYPAAKFTSDPGGCNFEETVTTGTSVSVTYLDEARTTKTATNEMEHTVSCYDPFARADLAKDSTNNASSGAVRLVNVPPDVTGMTCPASGRDDWNRTCTPGAALAPFADNAFYWAVVARNQSNVAGVAVIEDDTLDLADAKVNKITTTATTPAATVEWTRNDGETGTASGTATAPAGTWFTKAKITSGAIAPSNVRPSDTGSTPFSAAFHYSVSAGAPVGERRTNTAKATMSWPDSGLDSMDLGTVSRTIQFRATPGQPGAKPAFAAAFPSPAAVEGGGNAVPGKKVTFSVNGKTANVPGEAHITPQYVFIAPVGWTIDKGSAAFPPGSVPDGVSFNYSTKTIGGASREVVVASWPNTVAFGENTTWPTMTVVAQPTFSVAAGTTSVATAWMGDSRSNWDNTEAVYAGPVQNTPDVNDDGNTSAWFSSVTQNVVVSSADALIAVKEICQPTPGAADGCTWLSDPDELVGVSPTATDIKYRITLKNTGNTTLNSVVAYDVLPYAGDKGTSAGTADVPRGSTFDESLASVSDVSDNLSLSYSASTNPKRDEVYPSAPGAVDDWGQGAAGKKAIRATVQGSLAPGKSASFTYSASVEPGSAADAVACNSVATRSAQTLAAEPRPVCATTQEADLSVAVPDRLPLQEGRPGVVPFTVKNGGGSEASPAKVSVSVPAGLTVTSLKPKGWACTASPEKAPYEGPLSLTCTPMDGDAPGEIQKGVDVKLGIPVVATAQGKACVKAAITGPMHDPDLSNNEATGCTTVQEATAGLSLSKSDGLTSVAPGQKYTYTLDVANLLPSEKITGAVLTDVLPADVTFVSATQGGQVTGQGEPDAYGNRPGGVVTWALDDLGGAAAASPGGDKTDGGTDTTASVKVTVLVMPDAKGDIVNTATVTAPDPADDTARLSAEAKDTDGLRSLSVAKKSDAKAAGVSEGDTVTYTVTVKNTGTADYTDADPAVVTDDLAGVLDDADFVKDSASVTVGGGSATKVDDPAGGLLSWEGALKAGATATLTYKVTVKEGGDHVLANTVYGGLAGTVCDKETGRDGSGVPCAATSDGFAPELTKSVRSTSQGDDGRWTVEYAIDVVNPSPGHKATYDLSDDLRFGKGIDVVDAEVTTAPQGAEGADAWHGSGTIASDVELPGGKTHEWVVTVTADAHGTAGTEAGQCADGSVGGFANRAVLTLAGDVQRTAEACAAPITPAVAKTVDGAPKQNDDGSWDIPYLITVGNAARTPADGLSYGLRDALAFPEGVEVKAITATSSGGADMNPEFNGGLDRVGGKAVTPDDALLTKNARVPAATDEGPGTDTYRVTVTARADRAELDVRDAQCSKDGGRGWANTVTLTSTDAVIAKADACADIALPEVRFTKSVDKTGPVRPGDVLTYTITAENTGDADFTAGDPAGIEDDMSDVLTHATYQDDAQASAGTVEVEKSRLLWTVPIKRGETVTLTYSVVIGEVTDEGTRISNGVFAAGTTPSGDPQACPTDPSVETGKACTVTTELEPEPEPSPSPTEEPSPTGEPTPTVEPSETGEPSPTASPTETVTPEPSATVEPS
ncbi:hypothetical protein AB0E67_29175, partial [Streptomyces sp. NPDC032161]